MHLPRLVTNKLWASTMLVLQLSACDMAVAEADSTTSDSWVDPLQVLLSQSEADGASGILRVTLAGQLLFESGFGSASCDSDEPVTPEHLFMIGSITKELTQLRFSTKQCI